MRLSWLLALFFFFFGCKTIKMSYIEAGDDNLRIKGKSIYFTNDTLKLEIVNVSGDTLLINNPVEKQIEFFDTKSNKWTQLKILRCPCAAPCAPVPDMIRLFPSQKLNFTWDLHYNICEPPEQGYLPNTRTLTAQPGKYRVKFFYRLPQGKTFVLYYDFQIKNKKL